MNAIPKLSLARSCHATYLCDLSRWYPLATPKEAIKRFAGCGDGRPFRLLLQFLNGGDRYPGCSYGFAAKW